MRTYQEQTYFETSRSLAFIAGLSGSNASSKTRRSSSVGRPGAGGVGTLDKSSDWDSESDSWTRDSFIGDENVRSMVQYQTIFSKLQVALVPLVRG